MCAAVDVARKMGNSFCPCQGLVTNDAVGKKNQRHYLLMGDNAVLKVVLGDKHMNKILFSWPQALKASCTHQ